MAIELAGADSCQGACLVKMKSFGACRLGTFQRYWGIRQYQVDVLKKGAKPCSFAAGEAFGVHPTSRRALVGGEPVRSPSWSWPLSRQRCCHVVSMLVVKEK